MPFALQKFVSDGETFRTPVHFRKAVAIVWIAARSAAASAVNNFCLGSRRTQCQHEAAARNLSSGNFEGRGIEEVLAAFLFCLYSPTCEEFNARAKVVRSIDSIHSSRILGAGSSP